jgi:hypothetical protein
MGKKVSVENEKVYDKIEKNMTHEATIYNNVFHMFTNVSHSIFSAPFRRLQLKTK